MKTSFPYHDVYSVEHKNAGRYKGYSVSAYTETIREIVEQKQPASLLDYGCGKGFQYLSR
jgi:hypothetical protein